jgi:hypothetical protein
MVPQATEEIASLGLFYPSVRNRVAGDCLFGNVVPLNLLELQ